MILQTTDLTVRFGGVTALNSVTLDVDDGEVLGLVGPNGSGKSTFLNAVTSLVKASGQVRVDGNLIPLGSAGRMRRAGVLRTFQTPQVYGHLSCIDNAILSSPDSSGIGLVGSWLNRPAMLRAERQRWAEGFAALERVGLGELATTETSELSYGQQRMVELARVMVGKPRLVLLDEPAAGLNSAETSQLAELLLEMNQQGVALLVVDHKIDFLDQMCDRLAVLQLGDLITTGPPAEVWANAAVMDAYLGTGR